VAPKETHVAFSTPVCTRIEAFVEVVIARVAAEVTPSPAEGTPSVRAKVRHKNGWQDECQDQEKKVFSIFPPGLNLQWAVLGA
jgi:hypothetical protein